MMNSNLNLSALPECKFAYQMVNSALLIPCAEYQRVLHVEKVAHIAENFSEYEGEYSRERLVQQLARTHPKPSRSWHRKTPEVLQTAICGRFFASITVPAVR